MKKLLIGCGVVVLVLGVVVVGIGYYGYMKVKGFATQYAELAKVPDIEREIRVKTAFTPPASGELTTAQVDRFMQVQAQIRARIGQDAAAFERNYRALAQKKAATAADLPALMSAYKDIAAGWLDAKRAQVQALNDVGMSLDEYRWIRSSAYQAIGAPFVEVDFARIARDAKAGAQTALGGSFEGALRGTPPAINVKLVEKFRKQLEDNLALASFGL